MTEEDVSVWEYVLSQARQEAAVDWHRKQEHD